MNSLYVEPHIHMHARTTDDYMAMYRSGIRVCVEPSFWLGIDRRYAGSFWDYFRLLLEFEPIRAERHGIDHYACIAVNPKEAENRELAHEVIDGMRTYLEHPRCIAIGEIGFHRITRHEEEIFQRQLEIAKERRMLVVIHSPHDTPSVSKRNGVERTVAILRELRYDEGRIVIDHNNEDTMGLTRRSGAWAGLTVYPYSKLNPARVADILKRWGVEQTLVNSSADWGVSDPLTLPKVAAHLAEHGFRTETVKQLLFENPMRFYGQEARFKPRLDLPMQDPAQYQR